MQVIVWIFLMFILFLVAGGSFSGEFRHAKNRHLQNFYVIVPPLVKAFLPQQFFHHLLWNFCLNIKCFPILRWSTLWITLWRARSDCIKRTHPVWSSSRTTDSPWGSRIFWLFWTKTPCLTRWTGTIPCGKSSAKKRQETIWDFKEIFLQITALEFHLESQFQSYRRIGFLWVLHWNF